MTNDWQLISSAPKDGSTVRVKRIHEGREVCGEKLAAWRTVRFGSLYDPLTGTRFVEERDETGWMYADKDKRVPTPTHWLPEPSGLC